jgi:hypothetical protein
MEPFFSTSLRGSRRRLGAEVDRARWRDGRRNIVREGREDRGGISRGSRTKSVRAHGVKRPQFSVRTLTSRRRDPSSQENAGPQLGLLFHSWHAFVF